MGVNWPTLVEVIECEDVETCLRWNRFLPLPKTVHQDEVIRVVANRLATLRSADNDAYVEASKNLGWDR